MEDAYIKIKWCFINQQHKLWQKVKCLDSKCNAYSQVLPPHHHFLIHAKCIHFLVALTIHHISSPSYLTFFNDFGWKYDLFRLTRRIVFTRLFDNWLITLTKLCLRNICKNVCVGRLFIYFVKNRNNSSFSCLQLQLQFSASVRVV